MNQQPTNLSKETRTLVHVLGGARPRLTRTQCSSGLTLVTLHLARCEDYPDGNSRCGYQILAPLDARGRLDAHLQGKTRPRCLVRRFWEGDEDRMGRLVHCAGGKHGATWRIEFVGVPALMETGYNWQDHTFKDGEYVSIAQPDGRLKTFKVTQLLRSGRNDPIAPAAKAHEVHTTAWRQDRNGRGASAREPQFIAPGEDSCCRKTT